MPAVTAIHPQVIMPKKAHGRGECSSGTESKPQAYVPTRKFRLSCAVKESHKHPIYCVAFSPQLHKLDECSNSACFATCGGPYATIYEVAMSTNSGKKSNGSSSKGQQPLSARQVYRDVDGGEQFYTCAFGGRGVGNSAVGIIDDVDEGGDGIIYFGDDKEEQRKRPAKRQKQSEPSHPHSDSKAPLLCVAGTRGVIKIIDTSQQRRLVGTLANHGNEVHDLKFSPTNEEMLLSCSKDESIRLWNLGTLVNVAVFTGHCGHHGQVLSISWHLSGIKFASGGMDNTVKLWNVFDGDTESGTDGPIESALRKSEWRECDTINQQFPYFSTNEVHTSYVGKCILSFSPCEMSLYYT